MSESKTLSAADIFGASDLAPVSVEVPEWGGAVKLRPLTASEAFTFADLGEATKARQQESMVRILVLSAVDDAGNPLFTDGDVERLKNTKAMKVLVKLQQEAMILNGFAKREGEEPKNA